MGEVVSLRLLSKTKVLDHKQVLDPQATTFAVNYEKFGLNFSLRLVLAKVDLTQ